MFTKIFSAAIVGTQGQVVSIEGSKQSSLPAIHVTGLPGNIVRESREKISACLQGFGYDIPSCRLLIHLFPADAPKKGTHFDLSMAVKVLEVESAVSLSAFTGLACLGELSLDGGIHPIRWFIPLLECLEADERVTKVLIPMGNAREAALIGSKKSFAVSNLMEVIEHLKSDGETELARPEKYDFHQEKNSAPVRLEDILGQAPAKRSLIIALAGRHHLLMMGPPGVGKTLLAMAAPALMPPLRDSQIVEVLRIHSLAGMEREQVTVPPFRSPHHSSTPAACLGGGTGQIVPGDVSLAHHGLLFLDELPEFRRDVVEGLREPLQDGAIHLHRLGRSMEMPSRFQLLAAMNPCPCGLAMSSGKVCQCPPDKVRSYRRKVSAAILDRIDLFTWFTPSNVFSDHPSAYKESDARREIERVRAQERIQQPLRARMDELASEEKSWIDQLIQSGESSFRGVEKTLSVAETISKLEKEPRIRMPHLLEAWSLRCPRHFHT